MVSGRATSGPNLIAVRPRSLPTVPAWADPSSARPRPVSVSRPVDPLYPEPSGEQRWVAEEPLPWLGPGSRTAPDRSLADLVDDGTVPLDAARLLGTRVRKRSSVLVIAGRAGAGKSTLLEALLPLYPQGDRRIRLRGSFETFAWETDDRYDPARAVLVAEEISGHLPTYLWGPPVGRFLGWRDRGAALIATAHGESFEDVARLVAGYPLRLPLRLVAAFDLIVHLSPITGDPTRRPVLSAVWSTGLTPDGGLTHTCLFDRTHRTHRT